jgi:hypothetical protein
LVSSAGKVFIENIDVDLARVIKGLSVFTSLTTLSVDFDAHLGLDWTLDLGNITRSCPLLEEITLVALNDFRGSLAPLQHVKLVCISAPYANHIYDFPHLSSLIPFNSAHCLTTLMFHTPTN